MRNFRHAMIALALGASCPAIGQSIPPTRAPTPQEVSCIDEMIRQLPGSTVGDCFVVDARAPWEIYIFEETVETYEEDLGFFIDGFCGIVPCGQWPPTDSRTIANTTTTTISWNVGGGASAEGKASLLTRLFADVGVSANIEGQLSGSSTTTTTVTETYNGVNCYRSEFHRVTIQRSKTGTIKEAEALARWSCLGGVPVETGCRQKNSTAHVTTVSISGYNRVDIPCCPDLSDCCYALCSIDPAPPEGTAVCAIR